jgi:DNA-binding NtrC family response regulator
MAKQTVLIVDDEATQRRLVETAVAREGYGVRTLDNGADAIALLNSPDGANIHAVILDLSMPRVNGLDVMQAVRPMRPNLPIIMLTAHSSLNKAVEAMRAGASDFLVKPASPDRIKSALAAAFTANDARELRPLTEKLADTKQLTFEQLVGKAPNFLDAIAMARKAAASAIPLLIEGESGVGKELIAQSVHSASPRGRKAFVAVNCGAIPANLIESTLFGHEKGAFTGAIDKANGRFVDADGGTLFLDEIGEMPLDAQVKLLRVLQEGEVQPVGSKAPRKVDVRVISATNRDLAHEVRAGRFREDLFYRLNVVSVALPPLRDRRADISALAHHFLVHIAASESVAAQSFSKEALSLLSEFSWPGNVRQLQNAIFRAAVLCDSPVLDAADFPQLSQQSHVRRLRRSSDQSHEQRGPQAERGHYGQAAAINILITDSVGQIRSLADIEAEVLRAAIGHCEGRMSEVAKRLGIGRSTLYRKLGELNLLA